ncbi:MAG: hypothetical protein N3A55_00505 [Methylohalobius sp.]|nr:hypothetical protein [Methylohalobius sp.]
MKQIAQLNAELPKIAAVGDWSRVSLLEIRRQRLIRQCLKTNPADPELLRCICGAVHTDRKLIRLRLAFSLQSPARLGSVENQLQDQLAAKVGQKQRQKTP